MINVLAVCPCIFQRSRPTQNWLSLIHLAFAKKLLIFRMLRPCFTCCAATSVYTSVYFWLFRNICWNDTQTINVRTWPRSALVLEYKSFVADTRPSFFLPVSIWWTVLVLCKLLFQTLKPELCVCLFLISQRMMADALLSPFFFNFLPLMIKISPKLTRI